MMQDKLTKREREIIRKHNERLRERSLESTFKEQESRGRSITVGTAFGGILEVTMRREDGSHTWIVLQPVEVVELINQMAAGIGCHIHLQPRQDFASWRSWNYTQQELDHFRGVQRFPGEGHPPHTKEVEGFGHAPPLPPAEEQPGIPVSILRAEDEQAVAIEAPKQRRSSKRAAATS